MSLGNQVVLKNLGQGDILGNDQDSKWIISRNEENKGWMFIKESNSGHYLRAYGEQKLTTNGIWFNKSFRGNLSMQQLTVFSQSDPD